MRIDIIKDIFCYKILKNILKELIYYTNKAD